jgi:hypothetical protein
MAGALLLALSVLAAHTGVATAETCHVDTVPAATLLLPYFEVNLSDPNGLTTLFSVNNAGAPAVLAHVVLWSDLAVQVLNFNVYLTGYDVQTINLRDVLVYGNLPQTASAGQDPADLISPKGLYSQDINFAGCTAYLPLPQLPAAYLQYLQEALTGRPSSILGNKCAGQNLGDNIARGYITIDTVNNCTLLGPGDDGYFAKPGAPGVVTDQNVLWGLWYIVNADQNYAHGGAMVAVEADASNPATSTPGRYTFYGRYDGWTAVDHREPLSTTFAAQYSDGGAFNAGTDLLVWRDSKVAQAPFTCPAVPGSNPSWYPQGQEGMVMFDEQEHAQAPFVCPFAGAIGPGAEPSQCPPAQSLRPFPAATQRVHIGGSTLPVPYNFGWLFLDLNTSSSPNGNNPPFDPLAAQAWVIATQSSNGHYAVSIDAFRLDSACMANHTVPAN